MKYANIPVYLRMFYPSLLWKMPEGNNRLYLTFDDGPHPEITAAVMEMLEAYNAKATFFCVGENVVRYPLLFEEIQRKGHLVGNHSHNHINGWKTDNKSYYENVLKCTEYVDSKWFRPPYGRIRPVQIQTLKSEFTIVMWTVLSYDYAAEMDVKSCIDKVTNHTSDGAIIVFHDSEKAVKNMLPTLEHTLKVYSDQGFSFERLDVE